MDDAADRGVEQRRQKPALDYVQPVEKPIEEARRFGYADPPYPGESYMYKESSRRKAVTYEAGENAHGEVDHAELIARLVREFPDGWALSTKSSSLRDLLPLCPPWARVMPWVKPFASYKPGVNPAYAWEPVIVCGGRPRGRTRPTVRDWVSANIVIQKGLAGVKPEAVAAWLFEVLGALPTDEFVDLFPGSGAVSRAWEEWASGRLSANVGERGSSGLTQEQRCAEPARESSEPDEGDE